MEHQGYVPTTLDFPPSHPVPIMKYSSYPRMDSSSHPRMVESSFPAMHAAGSSPYSGSITSASNSVSEFGFSDEENQSSSSAGQSYEYNWFPSPAARGHVGHSLPATSQRPQVEEHFLAAVHDNTNAPNNNGAGYYDSTYYAGFYGRI